MSTRTVKWRRWPAKTDDWPPTATIIQNTPSASQTRVQVDNPTDVVVPVVVSVAGVESTHSVAAGAVDHNIDVTHDEATQVLTVRASRQLLASHTPA